MLFDFHILEAFYKNYAQKVIASRKLMGRPLTLSEKILYAHLSSESEYKTYERGMD